MSFRTPIVAKARHRDMPAWSRAGAVIAGGSLAMALAAHVAVPFWPVPITLQSLVVLVLGALAGPGLAAGAMLAYLAEGLSGLPVFAHGSGPAVLAGPTGGYLLGFVAAAACAGLLARRGMTRRWRSTAIALIIADLVLFAIGVAWLATTMGVRRAIAVGVAPFLVGEILKIALAVSVVEAWRGRSATP